MNALVRRLFDKQIKLQNPLWWIGCGIIIAYRKILRLIPRKPQHNHCENCGCDVGASLWGWCSIPCLKALAAKSLNDPAQALRPEH